LVSLPFFLLFPFVLLFLLFLHFMKIYLQHVTWIIYILAASERCLDVRNTPQTRTATYVPHHHHQQAVYQQNTEP
jgi:hypothetical protein